MHAVGILQRRGASPAIGLMGRGVAVATEWKPCGAAALYAAYGDQQQRRPFSTDGPFRHIKPKFVERKKHFNEVLILGDRRKLLDTAQDVLNDTGREFPRAFWEILAKRCIQILHLFDALELARPRYLWKHRILSAAAARPAPRCCERGPCRSAIATVASVQAEFAARCPPKAWQTSR